MKADFLLSLSKRFLVGNLRVGPKPAMLMAMVTMMLWLQTLCLTTSSFLGMMGLVALLKTMF
jgi:hypothetical protein